MDFVIEGEGLLRGGAAPPCPKKEPNCYDDEKKNGPNTQTFHSLVSSLIGYPPKNGKYYKGLTETINFCFLIAYSEMLKHAKHGKTYGLSDTPERI